MELLWVLSSVLFLHQVPLRSCESDSYDDSSDEFVRLKGTVADPLEPKGKKPRTALYSRYPGEPAQYSAEKKKGDLADMFGTNIHHNYPTVYKDFGRRFVPQFPYIEKRLPQNTEKNIKEKNPHRLIPVKASPEEVLKVALMSAKEQTQHIDEKQDELMQKEILRTGDYWNSVWVEEVDPSILRSNAIGHDSDEKSGSDTPKLGSVKARIMPGSKLHKLVTILKQYSPRLLYVINNKNEN